MIKNVNKTNNKATIKNVAVKIEGLNDIDTAKIEGFILGIQASRKQEEPAAV